MKKTMLIIDDEKDLCHILKMAFLREEYLIECAFSLSDAHEKLRDHFDIVLLDNNLPDGTGLDYLFTHRREFKNSCVVIIMADTSPEVQIKAEQLHVALLIQKPFSAEVVKEKIRALA